MKNQWWIDWTDQTDQTDQTNRTHIVLIYLSSREKMTWTAWQKSNRALETFAKVVQLSQCWQSPSLGQHTLCKTQPVSKQRPFRTHLPIFFLVYIFTDSVVGSESCKSTHWVNMFQFCTCHVVSKLHSLIKSFKFFQTNFVRPVNSSGLGTTFSWQRSALEGLLMEADGTSASKFQDFV